MGNFNVSWCNDSTEVSEAFSLGLNPNDTTNSVYAQRVYKKSNLWSYSLMVERNTLNVVA